MKTSDSPVRLGPGVSLSVAIASIALAVSLAQVAPIAQTVSEPTDDSTSLNGAVHALFSLHRPETGPFPSDIFTVADRAHNTGRRVNLPYPDCAVHLSECDDLDVINTLDG